MPFLDQNRESVVVRVVYDGPPLAGKTVSLRALAQLLAQRQRSAVQTPEEWSGRTLYFDWMEYTGGLVAGHSVRCQVVTVPGQRSLAHRREYLLRTADVVIFVADSSPEAAVDTAEWFNSSKRFLHRPGEPPVGIVIQANKRDVPGALELDELRRRLGEPPNVGLVESVATEARGVREGFVFAVRLALDRVRQMMTDGTLPAGRAPEVDSSEELLRDLVALEGGASFAPAVAEEQHDAKPIPALTAVVPEPHDPRLPPRLPDSSVPSGLIFPAVTGRVALHEFGRSRPVLHRTPSGDWRGFGGERWRLYSRHQDEFTDLEDGRRGLIQLARAQTPLRGLLSEDRCSVLARTGYGERWRLWHLVRRETSARDEVVAAFRDPEGALRLVYLAEYLESAERTFREAGIAGRTTLDTASAPPEPPRYLDFVVEQRRVLLGAPGAEWVERILTSQLRSLAELAGDHAARLAAELTRLSADANAITATWAHRLSVSLAESAGHV